MGLATAKVPDHSLQDYHGLADCLKRQEHDELLTAVIASPDPDFRHRVLEALRSTRWIADEAVGGAAALVRLEAGRCQVLMLDRWLPDLDVAELKN